MIPEYVSRAFPCFVGKELQVVYAVAEHMLEGYCHVSLAALADYAGLSKKTAMGLVHRLEQLRVLSIHRQPGRSLCISFGDEKTVAVACEKHLAHLQKNRQKQTALARAVLLNNHGSSTTMVVQQPRSRSIETDIDLKKETETRKGIGKKGGGGRALRAGPLSSSSCSKKRLAPIQAVFEVYAQYPWAVQKTWKSSFAAKPGMYERCKRLCDSKQVHRYLGWVHVKLDAVQGKIGKDYKRYFATVMSETWFSEFFCDEK